MDSAQFSQQELEAGFVPKPAPLALEWFHAVETSMDGGDFVEGVLTEGGMSVVYGESNCGKTFFAADLGFHLALGRDWFGRQLERGGVIYIAAEGGFGIRRRVVAFRQHHGLEDAEVPFAIVPASVDLCHNDTDATRLMTSIKTAQSEIQYPLRLVVVDTLSRALAGGNENSPEDMGAYVRNIDLIRQETGAHLLSVHHTGKERAAGARGHSLLRAATDTEIEVTRDNDSRIATATVTKQRDLATDGAFTFSLEVVEIGTDKRGKPVTSCVVTPSDASAGPRRERGPRLSGQQLKAYQLLQRAIENAGEIPPASNHIPSGVRAVTIETWKGYCATGGLVDTDDHRHRAKAFRRAYDKLVTGPVQTWGGWVWVC